MRVYSKIRIFSMEYSNVCNFDSFLFVYDMIILNLSNSANDWYSHVYIWDLFSVLWVLILILFPTNILTTDKVKKQKSKKNEVIIEV